MDTMKWATEYQSRWPDLYAAHVWLCAEQTNIWMWSAEQAGSVDSMDVYEWLKSQDTVMTAQGPAKWTGTVLHGMDNILAPLQPWNGMIRGGVEKAELAPMSYHDWIAVPENARLAAEQFADKGLMWYQQ